MYIRIVVCQYGVLDHKKNEYCISFNGIVVFLMVRLWILWMKIGPIEGGMVMADSKKDIVTTYSVGIESLSETDDNFRGRVLYFKNSFWFDSDLYAFVEFSAYGPDMSYYYVHKMNLWG